MIRPTDEIRCFLAANLSADSLRCIQAVQRHIREVVADADFRWAPAEKIHLTFKFFGNISDALVPAIEREIGKVLGSEPPLVFDAAGVEAFPPGRPRMIWAGIRESEPPRLGAIQARIEEALAELGFEREGRPFHPHLTLARARGHVRGNVALELQPFAEEPLGRTVVRELDLYRSDLRPDGPHYTVLRRLYFQET